MYTHQHKILLGPKVDSGKEHHGLVRVHIRQVLTRDHGHAPFP